MKDDRPERIYEVRAIGKAILTILLFIPIGKSLLLRYFLFEMKYKIQFKVKEHTSDITSDRISKIQIASKLPCMPYF